MHSGSDNVLSGLELVGINKECELVLFNLAANGKKRVRIALQLALGQIEPVNFLTIDVDDATIVAPKPTKE